MVWMLTQGWFCCKHCAAAATLSKGWLPVLQATAGFTHVTEHQLLCLKLQYDLSHRFAQEHADITRKSPQLLGTYCQRNQHTTGTNSIWAPQPEFDCPAAAQRSGMKGGGGKRVGAGLSLDKFAKAGFSSYDKRKVIAKQMALKSKQFNKYKRLKKRLEAAEGQPAYSLDQAAAEAAEQQQQQRKRPRPAADSSDDERDAAQHQQQHQQHMEHLQQQQQQRAERRQQDEERQRQQQQERRQQGRQQHQQRHHGAHPIDDVDEQQQQQQHDRRQHREKPKSQLQRLAEKAAADKAAKEQERAERERLIAERKKQSEEKKKQRSHQKHDFFRKTKRGQPVMKYRVDKILAQLQQEKAAGR